MFQFPVSAADGVSTAEGPSVEVATSRAIRLKPMNSEVVDVACRKFYAAGSQRFRCNVDWILTSPRKAVDWLNRLES